MCQLDWEVPVMEAATEKGELEATVLSTGLRVMMPATPSSEQLHDDTELLLQTTLVKLFAVSSVTVYAVKRRGTCNFSEGAREF